jgi:succinate dehydrogenase/fumarate reductase flavoprotein subunit
MSELVGIVRNESGLAEALDRLLGMAFGWRQEQPVQEVNNKLINARLIAGAAMNRLESRGAHFRSDYPEKNDAQWKKRLVACYDLSERRVRYATAEIGGTRERRP